MSKYEGKLSNKGCQEVKAPHKSSGGKEPTVKTGGDLRAKGSK